MNKNSRSVNLYSSMESNIGRVALNETDDDNFDDNFYNIIKHITHTNVDTTANETANETENETANETENETANATEISNASVNTNVVIDEIDYVDLANVLMYDNYECEEDAFRDILQTFFKNYAVIYMEEREIKKEFNMYVDIINKDLIYNNNNPIENFKFKTTVKHLNKNTDVLIRLQEILDRFVKYDKLSRFKSVMNYYGVIYKANSPHEAILPEHNNKLLIVNTYNDIVKFCALSKKVINNIMSNYYYLKSIIILNIANLCKHMCSILLRHLDDTLSNIKKIIKVFNTLIETINKKIIDELKVLYTCTNYYSIKNNNVRSNIKLTINVIQAFLDNYVSSSATLKNLLLTNSILLATQYTANDIDSMTHDVNNVNNEINVIRSNLNDLTENLKTNPSRRGARIITYNAPWGSNIGKFPINYSGVLSRSRTKKARAEKSSKKTLSKPSSD